MDATRALTVEEHAELDACEAEIQEGVNEAYQGLEKIGRGMATIRDRRLYKARHSNFDDYCRERWNTTGDYARKLIAASATVLNIKNNTIVSDFMLMPESESQVRPLTKLEPEQQVEAWARAVETAPNGKVTGAHVKSVVATLVEEGHKRGFLGDDVAEMFKDYPQTEEEEAALRPTAEPEEERMYSTVWPPPARPRPAPAPEPEPEPEPEAKMAVHFSSASAEHWTPEVVWQAAKRCMGTIDVDPCSNSKEHPNVEATWHFTEEDDGLARLWVGTVFMNPPYGREIGKWVEKLVGEYELGRVYQAIALVPARTDTKWWAQLRDFPVCFVEGRLTFVGNEDPAPFPSAIFYLGEDLAAFYAEFSCFGDIWQRLEPEMFGA